MKTVEIYKDREGTEYKLVKANRVKWIVERVSDGRRMNGHNTIFTFVRTEFEEEVEPVNPLIRPGALVDLTADCPIVLDPRNSFSAGDTFVVLGFGKIPGEFKIIEVGGNPRNQYFSSVHPRYLSLGD